MGYGAEDGALANREEVEVKVDGIRSRHSRARAPAGHGRDTLSYIYKNK